MKKSFILLVGLFMSLGAEPFKDLPGFGKLEYPIDCGWQCTATQKLPELGQKVWIDYIVFGDSGELTNKHKVLERAKTANNAEEADTVVTVIPMAIDEEASGGWLNNLFTDGKGDSWRLLSSNMNKEKSNGGAGTSAAILTSGMSSAGMSNSASAGAGLLLTFLEDNYPEGSFVYQVKTKSKQGLQSEAYFLFKGQSTVKALFELRSNIKDAIR